METHVRVIGVIFIVFGCIGLLVGLAFFLFFGGLAMLGARDPQAAGAVPLLGGLAVFLLTIIGILSIPDILAGIGLLKRKNWARILGVILCALSLPMFPLGTAFGIYGLWTLLNQQTIPLFKPGYVPIVSSPPPPPPTPPV